MTRPRLKILQFVKGSERYGASVSIRNLALELNRRGHEVSLLLHRGRSLGFPAGEEPLKKVEIEPHNKFSIGGMLRLRDLLKLEAPDVLHTHLSDATLSGTIAARLARIPCISTVHGMNRRWTYSFANRLIAVSEAGKQNLVSQGVSARKISVAYNGIPIPQMPTEQKKLKLREQLGVCPETLVLSTISRADKGKGIQDAINAVAMVSRRLPDSVYYFAGEGDYLQDLKQLSNVLGLNSRVRFLGFVDDVYAVLGATDLFIFPSHKEAMGISLVEAMAMQVPTIASDVGGIPEVLNEESGVLVKPQNVPDLAAAILELGLDKERRHRLGSNARELASDRFSLEKSVDAVEEAYELVLRRS